MQGDAYVGANPTVAAIYGRVGGVVAEYQVPAGSLLPGNHGELKLSGPDFPDQPPFITRWGIVRSIDGPNVDVQWYDELPPEMMRRASS
jgi:hypothetical protein